MTVTASALPHTSPVDSNTSAVLVTEPAGGTPPVVDTVEILENAICNLEKACGPIAVDTERAAGFRYGNDAYLVQIKRGSAPIVLLDPQALAGKLGGLAQVLDGPEWILHAADQDLPCLGMLGFSTQKIFDTSVAAQLLGDAHFGLGAVVEKELGIILAKEHSAADWSFRPLPIDWLNYAALDVEFLAELRTTQTKKLQEIGRWEWAIQEFEHLRLAPPPAKKADPWRKIKKASLIETGIGRQMLKSLYEARDSIARDLDISPSRILSPQALLAVAMACPRTRGALANLPEFKNKGARRRLSAWWRAVEKALKVPPDKQPPKQAPRLPGELPKPRSWNSANPKAANRLELVKVALQVVSEETGITEIRLLESKVQRRLAWDGFKKLQITTIEDRLHQLGARPWQVALIAKPLLAVLKYAD